jgi:hypothetical protein
LSQLTGIGSACWRFDWHVELGCARGMAVLDVILNLARRRPSHTTSCEHVESATYSDSVEERDTSSDACFAR